jgi:hypothetical protein
MLNPNNTWLYVIVIYGLMVMIIGTENLCKLVNFDSISIINNITYGKEITSVLLILFVIKMMMD